MRFFTLALYYLLLLSAEGSSSWNAFNGPRNIPFTVAVTLPDICHQAVCNTKAVGKLAVVRAFIFTSSYNLQQFGAVDAFVPVPQDYFLGKYNSFDVSCCVPAEYTNSATIYRLVSYLQSSKALTFLCNPPSSPPSRNSSLYQSLVSPSAVKALFDITGLGPDYQFLRQPEFMPPSSPIPSPSSMPANSSGGSSAAVAVGVSVSIVALIIIGATFLFFWRRRKGSLSDGIPTLRKGQSVKPSHPASRVTPFPAGVAPFTLRNDIPRLGEYSPIYCIEKEYVQRFIFP